MIRITDLQLETLGPLVEKKIVFEGNLAHEEFVVFKVELRLYAPQVADSGGNMSKHEYTITALVETNKGSAEMKYLENQNGKTALESAANLLSNYVGISSLVNRAILELISAENSNV